MASDANRNNQWDRVAAELRAYREAQQRVWGDIDNTTLGRYLAGEVTSEEQQHIENALHELPELRKLTELVRDVLGESETVPTSAPALPAILPFSRPTMGRREGRPWLRDTRFRQRAGLVAAAGLLLCLGFALPRSSGTAPQMETSLAMSPPVATHVVAFGPDEHFQAGDDDRKVMAAPPLRMAVAAGGGQAGEKRETLDRLDASVRTLEAQGKMREAKILARQYARNLTRQALVYQEKGDLTRAEPALHQACALCENTLGPQAAETVRTRHSLAGVYAIVLNATPPSPSSNTPAGVAAKSAPARSSSKETPSPMATMPEGPREGPAPTSHHEFHAPRFQRATVAALRERITRQSQRELRTSVAPVLTQALREASDTGERQRLARALGQLGPAGREAVPLLIDCYRQTTEPSERANLLTALGKIGPPARLALPLFVDVIQKPDEHRPEVYICAVRALRNVGPAVCHRDRNGRLSREVMRYLDNPAGRSGIVDEAECFHVSTIQQGQEKIHHLATTHRIEVFIETVPDATIAAPADKAEDHQNGLAVHLCINKDVPRVQMHISEPLRKQGLTDTELRQVLEPHLQKKDFDRALQASVEYLAAFEGKQGKK